MAVLAIASARSCGVTTFAAGLAMLWPRSDSRLLVEADPAGGVLAAGAGLAPEPGLVSLAAAARRRVEPVLVFEHCQALPDGTPVLCAPPGADRARSALGMAAGLLGQLGDLDAEVFLDCGRLDPTTPASAFFEQADLGVIATRPRLADLHALAALLEGRDQARRDRSLVLVGPGPYAAAEVAEALGIEVVGQLPWDREAAEAIPATSVSSRRLTRTPLVRALRTLAHELARRTEKHQLAPMAAASAPAATVDDPHVSEVNR